jgi:DNA-directed RNA polymerase specialized sigma subunit
MTTIDPELMEVIKSHARVALMKLRKPTNVELDDLISEGVVLLLELIENKKYDASRGASFKTFFIRLLRNYYRDMTKKSYRASNHFEGDEAKSTYIQTKYREENPFDKVAINILLAKLTPQEKQYAEKMVLSKSRERGTKLQTIKSRRTQARLELNLTEEQETELRNNLLAKMKG